MKRVRPTDPGNARSVDDTQQALIAERSEHFTQVILGSSQPFASGYTDGRLKFINAAFAQLTGYTEDELQGLSWNADLTPPEFWDHEREQLRVLLSTGGPVSYEKEYIRKDGRRISVELKVHLAVDEDGAPLHYYAFITDISERRAMERSLQESEQRFREVLENALDAAYRYDLLEDRYEYVSPVVQNVLGLSREQFIKLGRKDVLARVHPEDLPGVEGSLVKGILELKGTLEYRFLGNDGNFRWIADNYTVQKGPDGVPRYRSGIVRDINDRKNQELSLHANQHMLQVALEAAEMGTWRYFMEGDRWELSSKAMELYGIGMPEVIHDDAYVRQVLHLEDVPAMWEAVKKAIDPAGDGHYHAQYRVRNGEGWRWLNVWGLVEFSGQGVDRKAVVMTGASRDITGQKKAEAALRRSEERYRAVVDAQSEMVCRFTADGTIRFVNPAYAKAVNSTMDEMLGRNLWDFIDPADREDVRAMFAQLTPANPDVSIENRFLTGDGYRWTLWTNRGLSFDANGCLREAQATGIDITARKRTELLLDAQKRSLEMVVKGEPLSAILAFLTQVAEQLSGPSAVSGILLFDKEGFLRHGAAPSLPDHYNSLVDGLKARADLGTCSAAAATGKVVITQDIGKDPMWAPLAEHPLALGLKAAWSNPIKDRTHAVIGTFGTYFRENRGPSEQEKVVVEHLSRIAALAIEHRRTEEALRESDRRKDEFLATLAHELRNPLAPIRTGLEIMRLMPDNEEVITTTRDMMERQTLQMVRMIDDLLDISRITRDRLELRRGIVALRDVVRDSVEATTPAIKEKGQLLQVELPMDDILLDADPNRMAQVLSNLLNNASKFTPEGGRIKLEASRSEGRLRLNVIDDGLGIVPEMQARIFDMFTQVVGPEGHSQKGLGIGLTLTKRLVEMHGGTVEVHSDGPGRGSTFTIILPCVDERQEMPEATISDAGNKPRKAMKIMIADDNGSATDSLSMLMKLAGHQVRTAYDGEEAVQVAEEFKPDLVLLDIGMPRMNGFEAARAIRSQEWGATMVLVALTGWGSEDDKKKTMEAGFDHHLVKPAEPQAIREIMESL